MFSVVSNTGFTLLVLYDSLILHIPVPNRSIKCNLKNMVATIRFLRIDNPPLKKSSSRCFDSLIIIPPSIILIHIIAEKRRKIRRKILRLILRLIGDLRATLLAAAFSCRFMSAHPRRKRDFPW